VTSQTDDTDPRDERALVRRAQGGDVAAFRELYQRYAPTVHRFALLPLVHDRALSEDLLSDTFVRALENLHRFQWQGKGLLPWLIRIAKNLALDHLRRAGRLGAWPQGFEHVLPDPGKSDGESAAAHRQATGLMRDRIEACMGDLNPRYRRVLRMRLVDGLSREQAAGEMQVTIGTLDVLLFRACKAFRKLYVERYGEGPQGEFDDR
jgi:RNA polymerase sigma-70 factor (ECF subfamily)